MLEGMSVPGWRALGWSREPHWPTVWGLGRAEGRWEGGRTGQKEGGEHAGPSAGQPRERGWNVDLVVRKDSNPVPRPGGPDPTTSI